jgi:integrase
VQWCAAGMAELARVAMYNQQLTGCTGDSTNRIPPLRHTVLNNLPIVNSDSVQRVIAFAWCSSLSPPAQGMRRRTPEDARTGEFEEGRRGWKKCGCLIQVSGTLGGKFNRRQTGTAEWDEVKALADFWEKADSWDGQDKMEQPLPPPAEVTPGRVTIDRAVKAFLAELHETLAFATHKKSRLLLKRFVEFSEKRGYVMMDQWEPSDVRGFRTSWAIDPQTGARRMAMLKPFFEYCVANEWIICNPARLVKNPRGRDAPEKRGEQKLPFTDGDLTRMYAATKKYPNTYRHKVTGDDLAGFISLSVYTGLRISGTSQEAWSAHLRRTHAKSLDVITDIWRRKLSKVWDLCEPWKEKPTPHRVRHTFARILLQEPGVTVRDVAELLGNTKEIIRKHYGA